MKQALVGQEGVPAEGDAGEQPASVAYGLALAAWQLRAMAEGTTPAHLLAPAPRPAVSLSGLLLGTPEEVLAGARRLRQEGYVAVKLKVGRRSVREEAGLVRALGEVLAPAVRLRLDANRAWTPAQAAAFAAETAGCRVEYVEEPLADPAGLPAFAARHDLPVALDETLVGMPPEHLADHAYARAVVLKPTLLGASACLRIARQAPALGMQAVLSSAFESGVGLGGLLGLAAALGGDDTPAGLDTYRWLADDVLHPRLDLPAPRFPLAALPAPEGTLRLDLLREL
jgi:O-succinylbenzoate synthase